MSAGPDVSSAGSFGSVKGANPEGAKCPEYIGGIAFKRHSNRVFEQDKSQADSATYPKFSLPFHGVRLDRRKNGPGCPKTPPACSRYHRKQAGFLNGWA